MARLEGMNQIRDYAKRSESTVLMYIRCMEFPACKLGGIWISDTEKIDQWFKGQVENGINGQERPAAPKEAKKPPKTKSRGKGKK